VRPSVVASSLVFAAALLAAGSAAAEEGYPVSFVERPLTLPRFVLAPEGELDINRAGYAVGSAAAIAPGPFVVAGIQLGASFGITDSFEIGAVVLPIQFNSPAGYGGIFTGEEGTIAQPTIYATFRFLHLNLADIGARLRVAFLVPQAGVGAGALVEPSVPLLVHLGKVARLDAELGIPISVAGSTTVVTLTGTTAVATKVSVGVDIPVRFALDITEHVHLGLNSGVIVDDFGDAANTARIPLGIFGGYAIGEHRPILDIDPFFGFPFLIAPGVDGPGTSKFNPSFFATGVNLRGYLYL
jgi:hypothetical protein